MDDDGDVREAALGEEFVGEFCEYRLLDHLEGFITAKDITSKQAHILGF